LFSIDMAITIYRLAFIDDVCWWLQVANSILTVRFPISEGIYYCSV